MHKGIRMMRGGLLHRISMGLAALGIVLSLNAIARLFSLGEPWADAFLVVALVVLFFIGYSAWASASDIVAQG